MNHFYRFPPRRWRRSSAARSGQLFDFTQGMPSGIVFTRASLATDLLPTSVTGTFNTFVANQPRIVAGRGLLIEEQRTEQLGVTDTPATQTVTLALGNYTCWMVGSGSVAVTAGTGVATGLGTATQNTPNTFNVTTAGTFTFTPSGSVIRFDCESGQTTSNGVFPTSYIRNTGAVGTTLQRGAETCNIPVQGIATGVTILFKGRSSFGVDGTHNCYATTLDDGTSNNRVNINRSGSNLIRIGVNVSASTVWSATLQTTPPSDTDIAMWIAGQTNDWGAQVQGQAKVNNAVAAFPSGLNTLRFGNSSTGEQWNGTISKIKLINKRLSDTDALAALQNL